ncbi:MAG TPA: hypothetical protein VFE59_11885 [Trebonia sp.]|nr:hypothetical protein [Trebonia sp.]
MTPPCGRPDGCPLTASASLAASPAAVAGSAMTSCHCGCRKHRSFCWPVYSWVICTSMAWLVWRSPNSSGDAGSLTWKSIGPSLICTMTLSAKSPSSGMNVS